MAGGLIFIGGVLLGISIADDLPTWITFAGLGLAWIGKSLIDA